MLFKEQNLLTSDKEMKNPVTSDESFGRRLAQLRKSRGITQVELGKKIGVSQRVITYYERETKRPPAVLLPLIAKVLRVTIEELLGRKNLKDKEVAKNARIWKKLKRIEQLPPKDQRAVIHYIDALLSKESLKSK